MTPAVRPVLLAMTLALGCLPAVEPVAAKEKTGVMPGFTVAPSAKILLLRPRIRVGEQSTGGIFEPNADWTDQAKANMLAALDAQQAQLGNQVIMAEEPIGEDGLKLADYRALFTVLADAVERHQFFKGDRLPTKKRNGVFDWSIGPEIRDLPGVAGADYVLFISTRDEYGSTGRNIASIVGAFAGRSVTVGVHEGQAGLVDARTGNLVWLNSDNSMGGDLRTPEGAQRRVAQLLEGLPVHAPPVAATPASVAAAQ